MEGVGGKIRFAWLACAHFMWECANFAGLPPLASSLLDKYVSPRTDRPFSFFSFFFVTSHLFTSPLHSTSSPTHTHITTMSNPTIPVPTTSIFKDDILKGKVAFVTGESSHSLHLHACTLHNH